MLVLTRKLEQTIRIGDSILVTILRIERGQVRIGIEAPREVPVLRGELRLNAPGAEWEPLDLATAAETDALK